MTATYGPQHDAVAALVERARGLTPDEIQDLATAEAAAWAAAWAAVNAWAAAVDAAGYAAVDAAVDAALALTTRHLVGQHGYTAEHYDTLTHPWRTVIGPVHPDDPASVETIEETP